MSIQIYSVAFDFLPLDFYSQDTTKSYDSMKKRYAFLSENGSNNFYRSVDPDDEWDALFSDSSSLPCVQLVVSCADYEYDGNMSWFELSELDPEELYELTCPDGFVPVEHALWDKKSHNAFDDYLIDKLGSFYDYLSNESYAPMEKISNFDSMLRGFLYLMFDNEHFDDDDIDVDKLVDYIKNNPKFDDEFDYDGSISDYLYYMYCPPYPAISFSNSETFWDYLIEHDDQIDKLDFETLLHDYVMSVVLDDEKDTDAILHYLRESAYDLNYKDEHEDYLEKRQK